jgi:SAM-dependent methyltransferase
MTAFGTSAACRDVRCSVAFGVKRTVMDSTEPTRLTRNALSSSMLLQSRSGSMKLRSSDLGKMDQTNPYAAHIEAHAGTIEALSARWAQYRADRVDLTISPNDDMFFAEKGGLEHYIFVGTSALEVISDAMLLCGESRFAKILDLPCGYGRVTRHLVKFFPESEIFVSEIDKEKQAFCVSQFKVRWVDMPPDFSGDPPDRYDLIFVGSLLTHLNEKLSTRTLHYLVKALSEKGMLIFTTHGRHVATLMAKASQVARETLRSFKATGFGYEGGATYGTSLMAPSWILGILEAVPDMRVLGHMEQGWAWHQDVFIAQKTTGWTDARPVKRRWTWRL